MHALWSRDLTYHEEKLWFQRKKKNYKFTAIGKTPCADFSPNLSNGGHAAGAPGNKVHPDPQKPTAAQPQQYYEVQHQDKNHCDGSSAGAAWHPDNL